MGRMPSTKEKEFQKIINEIKNTYFYKNLNVLSVIEFQVVMQQERKMVMFIITINAIIVKYQLKKMIQEDSIVKVQKTAYRI